MEKISQNELVEKSNVMAKDEALNKDKDNDVAELEMDAQNLVSQHCEEKDIDLVESKKVAQDFSPLNSEVLLGIRDSGLDRAYPLNVRTLKEEHS